MSYGADFANADPAGAPLDPTIMIGADPFFWGAILLGLIVVACIGYFFGSRSNGHRDDAAQAIWKTVHEAARSAMGANDNALRGRVDTLLKVVDARLGKTMLLAGGLSDTIHKLRQGLLGRRPDKGHGGDGHGHDLGDGHGNDHGDTHHDGDHHADRQTHVSPAVTIVNVNAGSIAGHPPTPPPATGGRDLTQREQTDLLRLAVAAFNEHWREESARVGELRDAHAELSNPGSADPAAGRISGTRSAH